MLTSLISIVQWSLIIWAVVRILDIVIEIFSFLGGDGVQIYDISSWLVSPFSIRGISPLRLPILVGLLTWLVLLYGTFWAVNSLFL